MRVGNFSVIVTDVYGNPFPESGGYVDIDHMEQYKLMLRQDDYQTTNFYVVIDDLSHSFQMNGYECSLEQFPGHTGRFTAVLTDSVEGYQGQLQHVSNQQRGLIQVTFKPEFKSDVQKLSKSIRSRDFPYGQSAGNYQEKSFGLECFSPTKGGSRNMGTVQTGDHNQNFGQARYIVEDLARSVTISLRLRRRQAAPAVRPLANRVPPPVS